jgi:hypothetical protein
MMKLSLFEPFKKSVGSEPGKIYELIGEYQIARGNFLPQAAACRRGNYMSAAEFPQSPDIGTIVHMARRYFMM